MIKSRKKHKNKDANPKNRIITVLQNEEKVTWNKLWKKTGLSKSAFCKHLDILVKIGIVEKTVNAFRNPPQTLYSLDIKKLGYGSLFLAEKPISKVLAKLEKDLAKEGLKEEERKELFNKFFGYSLLLILAENLVSIYSALQIAKKMENQKEAESLYRYFQKETEKVGFEILNFCLVHSEYWDYMLSALREMLWIAHLFEEEEGELYRALEMLFSELEKLNIKKC